jgi:prepilin-type N-terminal cleavage/methylation domain-containing protein
VKVRSESGFSLIELLVATGLLLVVSSIVTTALMQMTGSQKTIWNRTEMHSGIRGATELLQQEVGQAGRIQLRDNPTLTGGAAAAASCDALNPATNAVAVNVSSVIGMFPGIKLTTMDGDASETVKVTVVTASPPQITACFTKAHAANAPLMALGGFAEGIIPPATTGYTNGSTPNRLKLFGDIDSNGNMVYVEYFCDNGDVGASPSHNLYRNVVAYNAGAKPALTNSQILLSNVYSNPNDTDGSVRPCFKYQTVTINNPSYPSDSHIYVLDVAITLTVQTQELDPVTQQKQKETKALLNVSPRNVFSTWSLAGMGYWDRVQPTPATLKTALLPDP